MTLPFPIVSGIIATDEEGHIQYKKGPISCGYDVESRTLDKSVFENYINTIRKDDLIVVGHNTARQTYNMLPDVFMMVSYPNKTHRFVVNHKTSATPAIENTYTHPDSKRCLLLHAFDMAIKNRSNTIHVLGGRSVYNAFAGQYNTMIHCTFKGETAEHSKTAVDVMDGLLLHAFDMPRKIHLDGPGYSVVEYTVHN